LPSVGLPQFQNYAKIRIKGII
jgi:hypothetical protein